MNQEDDERKQKEKLFNMAIDKPHLLLFTGLTLHSGKTIEESVYMEMYEPGKLQFTLASIGDEDRLEKLITFFPETLRRLHKIKNGVKEEVIPFKDKE